MHIILRLINDGVNLILLLFKPMRLGVKLLLIQDDQVLLVKHKYGNDWYLPGGGIQKGEAVEAAGRREAQEELGATLGDVRVFGIYSRPHHNHHVAVLLCQDFTMTGNTDFEIERFQFFPVWQLPPDASKATRNRVAEYVRREQVTGLGAW